MKILGKIKNIFCKSKTTVKDVKESAVVHDESKNETVKSLIENAKKELIDKKYDVKKEFNSVDPTNGNSITGLKIDVSVVKEQKDYLTAEDVEKIEVKPYRPVDIRKGLIENYGRIIFDVTSKKRIISTHDFKNDAGKKFICSLVSAYNASIIKERYLLKYICLYVAEANTKKPYLIGVYYMDFDQVETDQFGIKFNFYKASKSRRMIKKVWETAKPRINRVINDVSIENHCIEYNYRTK